MESFGKYGFVGRMGGDEFIALLSGEVESLFQICVKKLEKQIAKYNNLSNSEIKLSASYGNTIRKKNTSDFRSISEMYRDADQNMYVYKKMMHDKETEIMDCKEKNTINQKQEVIPNEKCKG